MPVYTYQCSKCKAKVISGRKIEERDTLPTNKCLCETSDYKRIIDTPPAISRSDSWGSKGNW
jgi:putative FmdB family regulatory protein